MGNPDAVLCRSSATEGSIAGMKRGSSQGKSTQTRWKSTGSGFWTQECDGWWVDDGNPGRVIDNSEGDEALNGSIPNFIGNGSGDIRRIAVMKLNVKCFTRPPPCIWYETRPA